MFLFSHASSFHLQLVSKRSHSELTFSCFTSDKYSSPWDVWMNNLSLRTFVMAAMLRLFWVWCDVRPELLVSTKIHILFTYSVLVQHRSSRLTTWTNQVAHLMLSNDLHKAYRTQSKLCVPRPYLHNISKELMMWNGTLIGTINIKRFPKPKHVIDTSKRTKVFMKSICTCKFRSRITKHWS